MNTTVLVPIVYLYKSIYNLFVNTHDSALAICLYIVAMILLNYSRTFYFDSLILLSHVCLVLYLLYSIILIILISIVWHMSAINPLRHFPMTHSIFQAILIRIIYPNLYNYLILFSITTPSTIGALLFCIYSQNTKYLIFLVFYLMPPLRTILQTHRYFCCQMIILMNSPMKNLIMSSLMISFAVKLI